MLSLCEAVVIGVIVTNLEMRVSISTVCYFTFFLFYCRVNSHQNHNIPIENKNTKKVYAS